ncbi:putative ABC-type ATPase, partial [Flavobacterium sp. PL11]|nr:putative ABC-type ATPase [Flavobacterium sp. PL11]
EIYLPIVDEAMIFDNSEGKHNLIAEKTLDSETDIFDDNKFDKLKKYYNEET